MSVLHAPVPSKAGSRRDPLRVAARSLAVNKVPQTWAVIDPPDRRLFL